MKKTPSPLRLAIRAIEIRISIGMACALLVGAPAQAQQQGHSADPAIQATSRTERTVTLAVLSLAQDARYTKQRLELAYPGQPQGRALQGVQLAAQDSALELQEAHIALNVREWLVPSADALPQALQELQAAQVGHIVADLPEDSLRELLRTAPALLGEVMIFNTGLAQDSLRLQSDPAAQRCFAHADHLLHTLPSEQMQMDALAQFLSLRQWRKVLTLQGTLPLDESLATAWGRALRRYGLQAVQTRPFKLAAEAQERHLSNVNQLTRNPPSDSDSSASYDVVAVLDSEGEFARSVPYATHWPRPVVGSAGLVAQAWHPQWQRYGATQLNRRFRKWAQRPMQGPDWAAWMAGKAVAAALIHAPQASVGEQLQNLRQGKIFLDGFKGQSLSFRATDGQLRQPVLLASAEAVTYMAPVTEPQSTAATPPKGCQP